MSKQVRVRECSELTGGILLCYIARVFYFPVEAWARACAFLLKQNERRQRSQCDGNEWRASGSGQLP